MILILDNYRRCPCLWWRYEGYRVFIFWGIYPSLTFYFLLSVKPDESINWWVKYNRSWVSLLADEKHSWHHRALLPLATGLTLKCFQPSMTTIPRLVSVTDLLYVTIAESINSLWALQLGKTLTNINLKPRRMVRGSIQNGVQRWLRHTHERHLTMFTWHTEVNSSLSFVNNGPKMWPGAHQLDYPIHHKYWCGTQ